MVTFDAADSSKPSLVLCFSEGEPHDGGLNLTSSAVEVLQLVASQVSRVFLATIRSLRAFAPSRQFARAHQQDIWSYSKRAVANAGSAATGLFAWKPYIIQQALRRLEAGQTLVYHDINIGKIKAYRRNLASLRLVADRLLQCSGGSIYVSVEIWNQQACMLRKFASWYVMRAVLGGEALRRTIAAMPNLAANAIVLRQSPLSRALVNTWLKLVDRDEWLAPHEVSADGTKPPRVAEPLEFSHHPGEQALLNLVLWSARLSRALPAQWPGCSAWDRDLQQLTTTDVAGLFLKHPMTYVKMKSCMVVPQT